MGHCLYGYVKLPGGMPHQLILAGQIQGFLLVSLRFKEIPG